MIMYSFLFMSLLQYIVWMWAFNLNTKLALQIKAVLESIPIMWKQCLHHDEVQNFTSQLKGLNAKFKTLGSDLTYAIVFNLVCLLAILSEVINLYVAVGYVIAVAFTGKIFITGMMAKHFTPWITKRVGAITEVLKKEEKERETINERHLQKMKTIEEMSNENAYRTNTRR